jgi:pimeloyl-ACP methyl ester carboxylesterase
VFIQVSDAKIFSVAFGPATGQPILGIGGWIGNWELWAEPFSLLSTDWHTIAYDHRGSGATLAPVESITIGRLVDDVFAVLDAYNVEKCILAAESAGALTAFGAALKQPERISGLVIVDGLYHQEAPTEKDAFLAGLKSFYPQTLEHFVQACVPEPDSEHIKRWGLQILNRASQESAIALYLSTSSVDLRPDLSRISQPTLILHGEADALVPLEAARWLAQTLPNSRLITLPGAGHVPTITRSQAVAQAIRDFFDSRS